MKKNLGAALFFIFFGVLTPASPLLHPEIPIKECRSLLENLVQETLKYRSFSPEELEAAIVNSAQLQNTYLLQESTYEEKAAALKTFYYNWHSFIARSNPFNRHRKRDYALYLEAKHELQGVRALRGVVGALQESFLKWKAFSPELRSFWLIDSELDRYSDEVPAMIAQGPLLLDLSQEQVLKIFNQVAKAIGDYNGEVIAAVANAIFFSQEWPDEVINNFKTIQAKINGNAEVSAALLQASVLSGKTPTVAIEDFKVIQAQLHGYNSEVAAVLAQAVLYTGKNSQEAMDTFKSLVSQLPRQSSEVIAALAQAVLLTGKSSEEAESIFQEITQQIARPSGTTLAALAQVTMLSGKPTAEVVAEFNAISALLDRQTEEVRTILILFSRKFVPLGREKRLVFLPRPSLTLFDVNVEARNESVFYYAAFLKS